MASSLAAAVAVVVLCGAPALAQGVSTGEVQVDRSTTPTSTSPTSTTTTTTSTTTTPATTPTSPADTVGVARSGAEGGLPGTGTDVLMLVVAGASVAAAGVAVRRAAGEMSSP